MNKLPQGIANPHRTRLTPGTTSPTTGTSDQAAPTPSTTPVQGR